jgi:hypothetical protein
MAHRLVDLRIPTPPRGSIRTTSNWRFLSARVLTFDFRRLMLHVGDNWGDVEPR